MNRALSITMMGFDRTQWKKHITLVAGELGMGSFRAWINRLRWLVERGHCPGTIGTVYSGEKHSIRRQGRAEVILVILLSDRNNSHISDRRNFEFIV